MTLQQNTNIDDKLYKATCDIIKTTFWKKYSQTINNNKTWYENLNNFIVNEDLYEYDIDIDEEYDIEEEDYDGNKMTYAGNRRDSFERHQKSRLVNFHSVLNMEDLRIDYNDADMECIIENALNIILYNLEIDLDEFNEFKNKIDWDKYEVMIKYMVRYYLRQKVGF
jgi:hypothetical protein